MTDPASEEWITIPEAAQRLGIYERQARRLVSRLPETERTAEGVRPAKVKWCPANVRKMGGKLSHPEGARSGLSENGPDRDSQQVAPNSQQAGHNSESGADIPPIAVPALSEVPQSPAEVPQSDPVTMSGPVSEVPDTQSALIEQYELRIADKDTEIAFLRAEIETHAREIERRDVAEGEMRRLMLLDREELQKLRSQLALPEETAPAFQDAIDEAIAAGRAAASTPRRSWIQTLFDRLRRRG